MQFLVVNRSRSSELLRFCELSEIEFFVSCKRANTVKQWILYQTCTGPDVTIIG